MNVPSFPRNHAYRYFFFLNSWNCCQHINGMAQIKQAKFGSVDINFVLGVGGYDIQR